MARRGVLGIVLAGGEGKRLMPLTADRAKPAVPVRRPVPPRRLRPVQPGQRGLHAAVRPHAVQVALARPAHHHAPGGCPTLLGNYVTPVPAQQRLGPRWYTGQRGRDLPERSTSCTTSSPSYVVVFGADHVYRMDPSQMVDDHIESGAEATVAGIRVPRRGGDRVRRDRDRPGRARTSPSSSRSRPTRPACRTTPTSRLRIDGQLRLLDRRPHRGAQDRRRRRGLGARHGRQHHPDADQAGRRAASTTSPTTTCPAPPTATAATGATSARWTPTTTPTWTSSRSTRSSTSTTGDWPILTQPAAAAARRSSSRAAAPTSRSSARGTIVSGGHVRRLGASPNDVTVGAGAYVEGSVLMPGVDIGRGAVMRRAILDKNVRRPDGCPRSASTSTGPRALHRQRRRASSSSARA